VPSAALQKAGITPPGGSASLRGCPAISHCRTSINRRASASNAAFAASGSSTPAGGSQRRTEGNKPLDCPLAVGADTEHFGDVQNGRTVRLNPVSYGGHLSRFPSSGLGKPRIRKVTSRVQTVPARFTSRWTAYSIGRRATLGLRTSQLRIGGAAVAVRPVWRHETPRRAALRSANDNSRNPPHRQRFAWDVYRAAARARYVGQVIAANADEAIEAAPVDYRTDTKKLVAVRRWEVA
jgi:hypothetical protein